MSAQKKREFEPVARLTLGGLRIAQLVETSNAKPTPNMPMESPSYTIYTYIIVQSDTLIAYPMDIHRCFVFDQRKLRSFQVSRTKRFW